MKQFHINRLTKLANFLETVPNKHFDLGLYYSEDYESSHEGFESYNKKKCGTVACACGWAATIPAFKKAGFKLSLADGVCYKNKYDGDAAIEFFGLNSSIVTDSYGSREFLYLFTDGKYKNPCRTNVIRRIRSFVKKMQKALNKKKLFS